MFCESSSVAQLNFFFGLGIFLLGMNQLEYGIRKLNDTRIRLWLRSSTGTSGRSVLTGVVTTALLQSSSMVSLLVLAFASAGILPLTNAIGIILGANLGTTFTGWLVAVFGFKLSLEAMALPLFGVTAFVLTLARRDTRLYFFATVFLGIALLLFGLGIMKTSMETLPQRWDISILQGHSPFVYLLFGIAITSVIQSSSAVMMMALAAISAGFITLAEAVPLIVGADLGTTSTTALASITGNSIKRKLAFAHFSYNFVVDMAAFFFLLPILPALLAVVSITDPLYSLVAFHSLMNILGLIAFMPFIAYFSNWIEKLFNHGNPPTISLLDSVSTDVTEAALAALAETVKHIEIQAACNNLRLFNLKPEQLKLITESGLLTTGVIKHQTFESGYEELKNQEGRILAYSLSIQTAALQETEVKELERLHSITRNVIFSNKSLKDVQQDLQELKLSEVESMNELYRRHKEFQRASYTKIIDLLVGKHKQDFVLEELQDLLTQNDHHAEESKQFVHAHAGFAYSDTASVSIQLNTNREIRHALKIYIKAIQISMNASNRDVVGVTSMDTPSLGLK